MQPNTQVISIENCVIRFLQPDGEGPFAVILMLHGWTGDENSMWIFSSRLPKNALLIAPRGTNKTKNMGYSWHTEISRQWPSIADFFPSVKLLTSIISRKNFPGGDFSKLHLLGFSEGAALAFVFAMIHPELVASVSGLSGFLPDDTSTLLSKNCLHGLPVFIAHGTEDELVPIERARRSVGLFQEAGANIIYCEDTVGHKLSAKCFRGLEAFYNKVSC